VINFLVVTHGEFGAYLVEAAEGIVGAQPEGVRTVSISPRHPIEAIRAQVAGLLGELDGPEGLIVVADMPGGTPSNVTLPLLKDRPRVHLVAGANLYMLVGAFARRKEMEVGDLARRMVEDGRRSVADMKLLLASRARPGTGG